MDEQVPSEIKKERVHKILELSNEYETKYYQSKIGKVYDGVVEHHNNGDTIVHTSNFIPVIVDNTNLNNNDIVKVKIEKVDSLKVYGSIL